MTMYNLNSFCNIIAALRRKEGWSQATFAEKLGISPQSISKWECGIGFPDVTFFPVIAEIFDVPIGVLFGEKQKTEGFAMDSFSNETEYSKEFKPCTYIRAFVGNVCRIEFIDGDRDKALVRAVGDPTFIEFFSAEIDDGLLMIEVMNPNSSDLKWLPYERKGYKSENLVQVFTGRKVSDVEVTNYLDLDCVSGFNAAGNYESTVTSVLSFNA